MTTHSAVAPARIHRHTPTRRAEDWQGPMRRIRFDLPTGLTAHCAIAALLALAIAQPAAAQPMDELYEKAKVEGSVVFYSGGPVTPYETFARDFEQRFPGVKVLITGGFSNVLNNRIEAQLRD